MFEDYDKKKIAMVIVAVLLVIIIVSALVAPKFYAGIFSGISGLFRGNGTDNNGTNPITNPDSNKTFNPYDNNSTPADSIKNLPPAVEQPNPSQMPGAPEIPLNHDYVPPEYKDNPDQKPFDPYSAEGPTPPVTDDPKQPEPTSLDTNSPNPTA